MSKEPEPFISGHLKSQYFKLGEKAFRKGTAEAEIKRKAIELPSPKREAFWRGYEYARQRKKRGMKP